MGEERSGIDLDEVSQPFPLIQKNVMVKKKKKHLLFLWVSIDSRYSQKYA